MTFVTRRRCLIGLFTIADRVFFAKEPCQLPNCFRPHSGIPGGLAANNTPMLVYFTFDDAVTAYTNSFFDILFDNSRKNPNGCPIRATHMNSYNYSDYSIVKQLYEKGHELASHSITHRSPTSWWATATVEEWTEEIQGQRGVIHDLAGIPLSEIRGMRAPFLQIGGDNQFTMLEKEGFMYDASMTSQTDPPSWPFTLQFPEDLKTGVCLIEPCPTKSYNIWEVPLNILHMDNPFTPKCSMVDGCRPGDKEEALKFLRDNFNRHYKASTKPAFGINMHAAWFAWDYNFQAMIDFVEELVAIEDVWIVPVHTVLQWVRTPTSLDKIKSFPPFQC